MKNENKTSWTYHPYQIKIIEEEIRNAEKSNDAWRLKYDELLEKYIKSALQKQQEEFENERKEWVRMCKEYNETIEERDKQISDLKWKMKAR